MLSKTLYLIFCRKIYVSTQETRPECKVCELRYRPIGTKFFIQECNLFFPIPTKNVIFNIHHLLFQNQWFFSGKLFKFEGYNLNNNCTHRITVEFLCRLITNQLRSCWEAKTWYKFYILGLFDQQEIQVEVHAIKALKYFSLVRNLVCTSILHHSNEVHIQIQWCSLWGWMNRNLWMSTFLDIIIYLTYTNK